MEAIGHQLMAFRVDDQMIDILQTQLLQITDKLGTGWGQSLSLECRIIVEAAYYGLSFADWNTDKATGSAGMNAVGLGVTERAGEAVLNGNTLVVLSYLVLKWSLLKLHNMSTLEGWTSAEQGSTERRMGEVLKNGSVLVRCLSVLSYAVFLSTGDCPSLMYRLTGINMAPRPLVSATTAGAASGVVAEQLQQLPAGHKSSQLFVEGKKMLWLTLLGATAAASITIDWQALRHYLYFSTHSLLSVLQQLRHSAEGSATARSVTAVYARIICYISRLLRRAPIMIPYSSSGGDGGNRESVNASDSTNSRGESIDFDLIGERSHSTSDRSAAAAGDSDRSQYVQNEQMQREQQQQQQCSACQLSPPEMPHTTDCGHVYCYLCIHQHMHSANSASQYDIFQRTDSSNSSKASCLVCFKSIRIYGPQII